jgi:hypothetical protein
MIRKHERNRARTIWGLALMLAASGCSGGADSAPPNPTTGSPHPLPGNTQPLAPDMDMDGTEFPALNATSFETAIEVDTGSDSPGSGIAAPTIGSAGPSFGAAAPRSDAQSTAAPAPAIDAPAAPRAPATPAPIAAPPSAAGDPASAEREIVEADIVQTQGDILYALNRYRGLVLIDMSVPDSPFVRGRVPFQAQPVDMYLRDGKAFIVMSDYFTYWQFDSDADPLGFHGSHVLVVDVHDPANPIESGGFNVDGEVTDTRIVGDVLYAVSKRNPDYWRYDTQDWQDTSWVLSIDLSDPTNIHQVDKHEFPGSANVIQVYETAVSVAAIDPNYYLVDDQNVRQTKITYVDISDPKGAVKVGGSNYVPGAVADKFSMDLSQGQLRVISQDWYWQPNTSASLTVFDASDPSQLVQRAQVPIANNNANSSYVQTGATLFSGPDLFVNLCWYDSSQRCRIDFYDLSNPSAPGKVGELAVNASITHFEARGPRLLSLGQQQSGPIEVELYDTTNLASVTALATADIGDQGASSTALGDYKAFKILDDLNMILLPLNWVENQGTSQAKYLTGAQIIDWQNDQLVARGRVAQSSTVDRVIAFKDRVLSISTEQLQVIDATNRDQPVVTANLFLVRNVVDEFSIGGYAVQLGAAEDDGTYRFFVLPFGADDMAKSVAELPVDLQLNYQMRSGNLIYVIGTELGTGAQVVRAADFSNPLQPRWRGTYRFSDDIQHIYSGNYAGYWSFYDYYWNPDAGEPLENQLLPVTTRVVKTDSTGRRFYVNALQVVDLRDPDNMHLATGSLDMPDYPFVNKVGHGQTLYSTHTEPALDAAGNPKQYHQRYFLDRVDASDPNTLSLLPKVNIPGRLVDVDSSGTLLYTIDYQFDEHGQRRNSFDVLRLDGDTATLVSVLPVGDEIDHARYLDREVWISTHAYPWSGLSDDSADSRQPYTRLTRLRFDPSGSLSDQAQHDVAGYDFDLLDVEGTRIYLASTYPTGLLVLDTANFDQPEILGSARTIGYVSKLVSDGDYLYMPMGSYGVRRLLVQ